MTQRFINNYSTTITQTFGAADTFLNVESVAGLPVLAAGEFFLLTVFNKVGANESAHEVVRVTAWVGNQLTVVRGIEGAAPAQFLAGDRVEARLTAGTLASMFAKAGGSLTGALNEAGLVNVASAATVDLGAAGSNNITITGTTPITSLGVVAAGAKRLVVFAGSLVLTHNAASLILPGALNITTQAGDVAEFLSLGGGTWRCVEYQRADGQALVFTSQATPYANTAVNTDAVAFGRYRITAPCDITLPAVGGLVNGTWIDVLNDGGGLTSWIRRNGSNIGNLAEDMNIDAVAASFRLVLNTGAGWSVTIAN